MTREVVSNPIEQARIAGLRRLMEHRRIAVLTDGFSTPFLAKTAIGLLRYRTADVAAVIDREHAGKDAMELFGAGKGIPVVRELSEVAKADAVYLGIAPPGGQCPSAWREIILAATRRGLDVVSGLHDFLLDHADYVQASRDSSGQLIDVRRNQWKTTGTGTLFPQSGVRIHTVGHDCSVGKMVASIELVRGLQQAGENATFLATGQTGIMISGNGLPIDCIVADFVNGAAERLILDHAASTFLVIEGQGSISHPAFSAVTAGLLHGCAPHGIIFCYEAGRSLVKGLTDVPIPPLADQLRLNLAMANTRFPCELIGFAINTRLIAAAEAEAEIARIEAEFSVPACDVYRHGPAKLVAASLALRNKVCPPCSSPRTA